MPKTKPWALAVSRKGNDLMYRYDATPEDLRAYASTLGPSPVLTPVHFALWVDEVSLSQSPYSVAEHIQSISDYLKTLSPRQQPKAIEELKQLDPSLENMAHILLDTPKAEEHFVQILHDLAPDEPDPEYFHSELLRLAVLTWHEHGHSLVDLLTPVWENLSSIPPVPLPDEIVAPIRVALQRELPQFLQQIEETPTLLASLRSDLQAFPMLASNDPEWGRKVSTALIKANLVHAATSNTISHTMAALAPLHPTLDPSSLSRVVSALSYTVTRGDLDAEQLTEVLSTFPEPLVDQAFHMLPLEQSHLALSCVSGPIVDAILALPRVPSKSLLALTQNPSVYKDPARALRTLTGHSSVLLPLLRHATPEVQSVLVAEKKYTARLVKIIKSEPTILRPEATVPSRLIAKALATGTQEEKQALMRHLPTLTKTPRS